MPRGQKGWRYKSYALKARATTTASLRAAVVFRASMLQNLKRSLNALRAPDGSAGLWLTADEVSRYHVVLAV